MKAGQRHAYKVSGAWMCKLYTVAPTIAATMSCIYTTHNCDIIVLVVTSHNNAPNIYMHVFGKVCELMRTCVYSVTTLKYDASAGTCTTKFTIITYHWTHPVHCAHTSLDLVVSWELITGAVHQPGHPHPIISLHTTPPGIRTVYYHNLDAVRLECFNITASIIFYVHI